MTVLPRLTQAAQPLIMQLLPILLTYPPMIHDSPESPRSFFVSTSLDPTLQPSPTCLDSPDFKSGGSELFLPSLLLSGEENLSAGGKEGSVSSTSTLASSLAALARCPPPLPMASPRQALGGRSGGENFPRPCS